MSRVYGERIMLREFRQEDISGMRSWATDNDCCFALGDAYILPQTWEKTERTLNEYLNGGVGGLHFAIAEKASGRYIGQCNLPLIDRVSRRGEMAIVLAPEYIGQGYGREAIHLMLGYAFGEINLRRVYLQVYADNERAIKCYRACGFREEGRMREHAYRHGRYVDIVMMGIMKSEWQNA